MISRHMQYTMDDGVCYDLTIETQAIIDKRAYITNLGVFLQVYFVRVRLPLLVGCSAAGTGRFGRCSCRSSRSWDQ